MTLCAAALPDTKWRKHKHSYFASEFHSLNCPSLLAKADPQMYHLSTCTWQSWENKRLVGSCCWVSLIMLLYHQRRFRWFCCSAAPVQSSCRLGVNISISPTSSNRIAALFHRSNSCENSQHHYARTIPHHSHLTSQCHHDTSQ